jgi:hypothetical protein
MSIEPQEFDALLLTGSVITLTRPHESACAALLGFP